MRSYAAARTYFSILTFLSKCIVIIGVIAIVISLIGVAEMSNSLGGPGFMQYLIALMPGFGIMFIGQFCPGSDQQIAARCGRDRAMQ